MKKRKAKDFIALYPPEDEEKLVLIQDGISADKTFLDTFWTAHTHALAMADVKTGQVTYAVRDTVIDDKEIKQDDYMGIGDKGILSVGTDMEKTVLEMIGEMIDEDSAILSIYYGEEMNEDSANEIAEKVEEEYPDVEVEVHYGGQPIYYYVISVE